MCELDVMEPSTRTPEGEPNRCPVCGKPLKIDPSRPPGDAPCPHCGHLLWFGPVSKDNASTEVQKEKDQVKEALFGESRKPAKGLTERLFEHLHK